MSAMRRSLVVFALFFALSKSNNGDSRVNRTHTDFWSIKPFFNARWLQHISGNSAIACAVLCSAALSVQAQEFAPFPEPAVGPFPGTENIRLLSQVLPEEMGAFTPRNGVLLNDIWGWTSPNGEEYALVGTGDGMSIVRVTDPANPQFIGIVPTTEPTDDGNLWGDIAVFNVPNGPGKGKGKGKGFEGYAYYTTEAGGVGINILALNQLDDMDAAGSAFFEIPATANFDGGGYESAHNIYVNQDSGFAYVAGAELSEEEANACEGQPFAPSRFNTLVLDLNADPLAPTIAACRADAGEHDIYVVNYRGVDRDYRGREIAFVFDGRDKDTASRGGERVDDTPGVLGGGTTEIWDVSNKENIEVIASFSVPGLCFSHQGWTSSDRHEFLLINDEIDEVRNAETLDGFFRNEFCATELPPETTSNPGIYVLNIQDLDNPFLQERFEIDAPGVNDHNFIRKGNRLYWAVYNAGTSVLRIQQRNSNLNLVEIGRLDSEPRDVENFNGQWGIFPFPDSKTIVASDINNGLMVMELSSGRPIAVATGKARGGGGRPDSRIGRGPFIMP
ncbi:hypothetical protein N9383_01195 [Granulosicoccus sp.]|nr:hypothetical protein [Granulosicoccus sp.]